MGSYLLNSGGTRPRDCLAVFRAYLRITCIGATTFVLEQRTGDSQRGRSPNARERSCLGHVLDTVAGPSTPGRPPRGWLVVKTPRRSPRRLLGSGGNGRLAGPTPASLA